MTEIITSLISTLFSSAISILIYVGTAYGLWKMATSCGYDKPWLAWIPFCNVWMLGAIADHYCAKCERRVTNHRKQVLGWNIAFTAILFVFLIVCVVVVTLVAMSGVDPETYNPDTIMNDIPEETLVSIGSAGLVMLAVLLALLPIAIIYLVKYYTAMNKVYKLFAPKEATLFTVLSIFFNIAVPILFFMLGSKPPQYPYEPAPAAPTDGGYVPQFAPVAEAPVADPAPADASSADEPEAL